MAPVVHQPVSLHLGGRQIVGDVNRNLCESQLARSEKAGVPGDDHALRIDHNRLTPAEFLNRCRDFIDRRRGDRSGIPRIRNYPVNRPEFNLHRASTLSRIVSAIARIINGGTEFPSRSHCCA